MRIVTRYIVREHAGPLVFALTALTSLLMLQYVARQLANLAGKGLPWSAIGKFFLLSLPFTIAMTMPMAVLVATLYAFGRMAAEQEVTAFKANGVRVRALMTPVLISALLVSIGMVLFNDQVLPRANHLLRVLQNDIARTKPALALRDQVLNTVTDQFVMKVARSDAGTGKIWDIVIYDMSKPLERKTISADSGRISLAPNGRDLQLELFDGHVQELVRGNGRRLQRTFFRTQNVRVPSINQGFELSGKDSYKGDREMSICELHTRYKQAGIEYARLREEYMSYSDKPAVANLVMRNPRTRPAQQAIATVYCNALASVTSIFRTKTADAAELPEQQSSNAVASQATVRQDTMQRDSTRQDSTRRDSAAQNPVRVVPAPQVTPVPLQSPPVSPQDSVIQDSIIPTPAPAIPQQTALSTPQGDSVFINSAFMSTTTQLVDRRMTLDQVAVEIHKKFALSFACLVFVLFGPPIALRFPRGGVGVTIGVSIVVFGAYYVCLMGGEALADNGRLPPFIAMWIANVVFGLTGVALLWRVERTTDASRGGGIGDWWADRKAARALRRAERAAARAATDTATAGAQ